MIILSLISACSFFSDKAEVAVVFPEDLFPEPVASWIVIYPESEIDGIPDFTTVTVDGADEELNLQITGGVNLPVLAYPVFSLEGGRQYTGGFPAGAFFPLDLSGDGKLELSWEGGAAAEIIRSCSLSSDIYRGFNAERLRTVMNEKAAEEAGEDLWMIDPEPILCRLGYGVFRESAVQLSETMEFLLPAATDDYLVSDNPLKAYAKAGVTGEFLITVPVNKKTAFFSEDGLILVYFNDSCWCWSNSATGAGESGRL